MHTGEVLVDVGLGLLPGRLHGGEPSSCTTYMLTYLCAERQHVDVVGDGKVDDAVLGLRHVSAVQRHIKLHTSVWIMPERCARTP